MASFTKLPPELLLRIAKFLAEDADRAKHLSRLALVSRNSYPIAQEVLYHAPAIDNQIPPKSRTLTTRLNRLIRTLLASPHLAKRVQTLALGIRYVSKRGMPASLRIRNVEEWDYPEIKKLCERFIQGQEMRLWLAGQIPCSTSCRTLRYIQYLDWLWKLWNGNQTSHVFTVVLLHLLPDLKELTISLDQPWLDDTEDLSPDSLFYSPKFVDGFRQLKFLTTNFMPPWSILSLPTLRAFHFDTTTMDSQRKQIAEARMSDPSDVLGNLDGKQNTNLVSLIVDVDMSYLEGWGDEDPRLLIFWSLHQLQEHLQTLKSLQIRMKYKEGEHHTVGYENEEVGYNELMPLLTVQSVETLMLDTSDVDWDVYAINEDYTGHNQEFETWTAEGALPLDLGDFTYTIPELSSLRRIVAPQEAYFSHFRPDNRYDTLPGEPFKPISLPPSVESIEIIDSTRWLNRWARYVVEHRDEFPSLARVVLWCDRHDAPFVLDKRLREKGEPEDDAWIQTTAGPYLMHDVRMEDDVDDSVWEELQDVGIRLVINKDHRQGWRDIQ